MIPEKKICFLCGSPIDSIENIRGDEEGGYYHYGCYMEQGDLDELSEDEFDEGEFDDV